MGGKVRLGITFGEMLSFERSRPKGSLVPQSADEPTGGESRLVWLGAVFGLGILLLFIRTFYLAGIKSQQYREIADQNRLREEIIRSPRSLIFDRFGNKLTQNTPIFRVEERDSSGRVTGYHSISREEALLREAKSLPVTTDAGRAYPQGAAMAHVVGYINEANSEELKNSSRQACTGRSCSGCNKPLMLGDFVGRGGLEEQYDCLLRGKNGRRIYETDTSGRIVRTLGEEQPILGQDLHTSLDVRLQKVATEALGGKDGAVVAMEASTGAVFSLVSSPNFDPNIFLSPGGENETLVSQILNSSQAPLLNRAIGGAYPAGSIFKLAVASAALEEKKITPSFTYNDPGVVTIGGLKFSNWFFSEYGRTEGVINLPRAITRSTDTFFYEVGAMTGPENIATWAKKFGFGGTTSIDIPGEVPGLIPTPEWKLKAKGEQWYLGNTYNMAIGQGDVLVTPLQVTQMTQVIANGGRRCQPTIAQLGANKCQDIGLKPEFLKMVIEGMVGACSPGGTAFPLFNFKPQVACKTGTAQFGIEGKLTHAWLTAFAPASVETSAGKPEIVVTALVEGGGEGSAMAAPVVKAVLEEYFAHD